MFIGISDFRKKNLIMITDTQIFIALVLALISALLAIRLGTKLYV
jgi:photosystem I reaction center subunit XII